MLKNKKAAMEMSIGTIVTIVLLMSVLVLGLVLITNIFSGATTSVKTIDDKVKSEINNIFQDETATLAISPSDKKMKIAQGTQAEGFVFAVNNKNTEATTFTYKVYVDPRYDISSQCGSTTIREVESWLAQPESTLNVPKSSKSSGVLVPFNIPETAPKCSIPYTLDILEKGELYAEEKIWVTIV
jgi:hypothetical protein